LENPMRLSQFIRQNHAQIGSAWDEFAQELTDFAKGMNLPSLRDHLDAILEAITDDMEAPESPEQSLVRSTGKRPPGALDRIAAMHVRTRLSVGFNLRHVLAEYRALRASILRLWEQGRGQKPIGEVIRFNETIDQAIAEVLRHHEHSVTQYNARFLAILAHDIRNPLHTIGLAAQALEQKSLEARTVARIRRSVQYADRLVDDLAIFVRSRLASALLLTKGATDLRLLCEQVLEDARAVHPGKSFNLTAQGKLTGIWDSRRLLQVISNLVANAAVHGKHPEIKLEARDEGPSVIVQVTSYGNPIAADQMESIFDPLVRTGGAASASSLSSGLGLGLFIVREIVTAHGGTVEVASAPDDGTMFIVRLPLEEKSTN
jgi:signal transduction histidine kinase